MTKVKFKDIQIGQEFTFDTNVYLKTVPEKISCCKAYTAAMKDHPAKKLAIHPETIVEIESND